MEFEKESGIVKIGRCSKCLFYHNGLATDVDRLHSFRFAGENTTGKLEKRGIANNTAAKTEYVNPHMAECD